MITFDEFLKQDDEEKYNNMEMNIFEIKALKRDLKNREKYITILEAAFSKEIERQNIVINETLKILKNYENDGEANRYAPIKEAIEILEGVTK